MNCPQCLMGTILYMPEQPLTELRETDFQFRKLGWGVTRSGHRSIVGELLNSSKRNFDWVRVQFTLLNSVDVPVGITSNLLIGFQSGAAWKFSAPVFDGSVTRSSLPVLSTEYGTLPRPKRLRAERPDSLKGLTESEYGTESGILSGYTDALMGKARTAGRPKALAKPHWSQLGSLT